MSDTWDINLYGQPVKVLAHRVNEYVYQSANKGRWKPKFFRVFNQFLRPGMTYVDIGAYVGATTLYPAALGCEVWAFEPDPLAYSVLERNIALNPELAPRIRLFPWAIGTENGRACFGTRAEQWGTSTPGLNFFGALTTEVESRRLQTAIEEAGIPPIDFLKVNVQGSEPELLIDAESVLQDQRPTLHVYVRPFSWSARVAEAMLLAGALTLYEPVFTERGEVVDLDALSTPAWLDKHDYKLLAKDHTWELPMSECPLCEAVVETRILRETEWCHCRLCRSCGVPMVWLKRHIVEPGPGERNHALNVLRTEAQSFFKFKPFRIDERRRTVFEHWHAHARPAGGQTHG